MTALSLSLSAISTHGQTLFSSLRTPLYTKATALGGVLNAHPKADVNLFNHNPALLDSVTEGQLSFQHTFYLAEISAEQLSYAHSFKDSHLIGFSLQYFNYGKFEGYDETGEVIADFNASDFILTAGYAHQQGNFNLGGNLKLGISDFADYFASAILFDVGVTFHHPTRDFTTGLTIRNFGFILSDYTGNSSSSLPFDVQLGTAFKPEHMPVRFHVNLYNLSDFDTPYSNTGHILKTETGTFDKLFSHLALGAEFLLSKNVHLLAGYNHLTRRELRLENKSAGAGLSYGLEITVNKFDFAYSRAHYVAGKAINQLGLSLNLKEVKEIKL